MLGLIALAVASVAVLSHSQDIRTIEISVARDGTTTPVPFSSVTFPDEAVKQNVRRFCSSIDAAGEACEKAVYVRFAGAHPRKSPTWSNRSEAATMFMADIIAQECSGSHAFQSRETCEQQIENGARSVKMVHAFQLGYQAEDLAEINTLVELPAGWRQLIEGNTFAYLGKVKTLQNLADDARVVRICEVGFNFGHSVSSLAKRFHFNAP
jgi:hypothetical protein